MKQEYLQLWMPDGRNCVCRRLEERFVECNLAHDLSFGGGSIGYANFVLMHDNARPYAARTVTQYRT